MPTPNRTPAPAQTAGRSRYGGASRQGISGKVIAVFVAALLALVVFMGGRAFINDRSQPVKAEFISQERVDDSTARLWVDVKRADTTRDAYCLVFAVSYDHSEIGRRALVIPAGGEGNQRFQVDLPTREPVASGRVYGCSQDIPSYMDTSSTYLGAR
ncbi:DUF4307 domain-containing protein [Corynebacterium bouchesdurhonense]|uniref:DUF4307 domain-containing protein n=1 Tax=Corynebacterium bouchesdurhonense TaxID=1720192 RepID=UPI000AACE84A|nr:DUF4307 domain-containing protein [Corynebacterium bouchesdurhonense]